MVDVLVGYLGFAATVKNFEVPRQAIRVYNLRMSGDKGGSQNICAARDVRGYNVGNNREQRASIHIYDEGMMTAVSQV